jgi:hypothetical protein
MIRDCGMSARGRGRETKKKKGHQRREREREKCGHGGRSRQTPKKDCLRLSV